MLHGLVSCLTVLIPSSRSLEGEEEEEEEEEEGTIMVTDYRRFEDCRIAILM